MSVPRRPQPHYAKHRVFWPQARPFRLTKEEWEMVEKARRRAKATEKIDEARRLALAERATANMKLNEDEPL